MGRIAWAVLVLAVVGVFTLTTITLPTYFAKDTIRGVDNESFLQATTDTLSPKNTHFSKGNISVKDVVYVDEKTAIVTIWMQQEELRVYILFEFDSGKIHLTNYTASTFSVNDFAVESSTTQRIINIMGDM